MSEVDRLIGFIKSGNLISLFPFFEIEILVLAEVNTVHLRARLHSKHFSSKRRGQGPHVVDEPALKYLEADGWAVKQSAADTLAPVRISESN